jgi:hypothetical protein
MRMLSLGLVITLLFGASLAQQHSDETGLQRVLLVDATQSVQMKDNVASRKSKSGVFVSKQFFIFKGPRATLRTKTTIPEFQFEVDPANDDPVYLFRLDVHSDRREIRVARGSGGLTQMSVPKDHIIQTAVIELGNGQNSRKRYRLKPMVPLRPGEYCLSRLISTCYDFGVD